MKSTTAASTKSATAPPSSRTRSTPAPRATRQSSRRTAHASDYAHLAHRTERQLSSERLDPTPLTESLARLPPVAGTVEYLAPYVRRSDARVVEGYRVAASPID